MTDRNGVEIDYCPKCRGVWLDRGELDKIIERAAEYKPEKERKEEDYKNDPDYRYKGEDYKHKRKRRGFLGDMFDFD